MRRWLIRASAFSLLGAIGAVIAAWIMAIVGRPMRIDPMWIASLRREAWAQGERSGMDAAAVPWVSQAFANSVGEVVIVVDGNRTLERQAYGWPWRALDGRRVMEGPSRRPARVSVEGATALKRELILAHDPGGPVRTSTAARKVAVLLPLTPRWPGFVLSAASHAAALALLWAAFLILRGRWRRWRRRCPGCGYPIGVSMRCSECGRPLQNATLSA